MDYGCGKKLSDGMPCTSEGDPFLCDVCTTKLVQRLEAVENKLIAEMASAAMRAERDVLKFHLANIMVARWYETGLNEALIQAGLGFNSVAEYERIVARGDPTQITGGDTR